MVASFFDRIPYDIFRQIILYSYATHVLLDESYGAYESLLLPPIEASHVCRSWRHALVADQVMWTFISFPDVGPEGVMELLHRSGSWALSVCIRFGGSGWFKIKDDTSTRNMLSALFDHLHRFKLLCLRINLTYEQAPVSLGLQVLSYIRHPAPQLETFVFLHDSLDYTLREHLWKSDRLFSGYAPRLKCMHSQLILHSYERHSPVLHNLTELSLFIPFSFSDNPDDILDILGSSPKLKFLDLRMDSDREWPVILQHAPTRHVVLPDLQKLIIEEYYTNLIVLVLGNVTFNSDAEWHFAARDSMTYINRPPSTLPQVLLEVPFTFLRFRFSSDDEVEMLLEEKRAIHCDHNQTNRNTLVLRQRRVYDLQVVDFWNISAMKSVNLSYVTRAVFEFEGSAQFTTAIFPTFLASLTRVESLLVKYNTNPFERHFDPSLSFLMTLAVGVEQIVQKQQVNPSKASVDLLWRQLYPREGPSPDWPLPSCLHLRELIVDVPKRLTKSQREILHACSRRRFERGYAVRILIRYPHMDVLIV